MKRPFLLLVVATSCKFPDLPPIDEDASPGDGSSTRYTLTLTVDAGTGAGSISVEPGGFT